MKEYRVQMTVKRHAANHLETIDRYTGSAEGALKLLHEKYVEPEWLERFEKRIVEELEEWNLILAKRNKSKNTS